MSLPASRTVTALPPDDRPLFQFFAANQIEFQNYAHPPIFTVAEGLDLHAAIPGAHAKSLLLSDGRDYWLVMLPALQRADLKSLAQQLGAKKLSFASPATLLRLLGVTPGSVSPFALINDIGRQVQPVLASALVAAERVGFHPLRNDQSTVIKGQDLPRLLERWGYRPLCLPLPATSPVMLATTVA